MGGGGERGRKKTGEVAGREQAGQGGVAEGEER